MLVVQLPARLLGQILSTGHMQPLEAGLLKCPGDRLRMGLLYDAVCSLVCRDSNPCGFVVYYRPLGLNQDHFGLEQRVGKAIERLEEEGKGAPMVLFANPTEIRGQVSLRYGTGGQGIAGKTRINWNMLRCVEFRKAKVEMTETVRNAWTILYVAAVLRYQQVTMQ